MTAPVIDIYAIDLSMEDGLLQREQSLLSKEEQAQAQRYVLPQLSRRYTAAHTALRRILGKYARTDPRQLAIAKGPYGKPYLPQHPHIAFNLSHSEDLALIAVTAGSTADNPIRLGIDLEYCRRSPAFTKISGRYFTDAERAELPSWQSPEFAKEFLRLWTGKEAVTKCLGTGLRTPLRDFGIHFREKQNAQVQWHISPEPARLFVREIDLSPCLNNMKQGEKPGQVPPMYLASLCSGAAGFDYKLNRYSPTEA